MICQDYITVDDSFVDMPDTEEIISFIPDLEDDLGCPPDTDLYSDED